MIKRMLLLATALVATVFMLPRPTGVAATHGVEVAAVAHGLRVSLLLQETAYPRDALAPVTVRVRNVSRQPAIVLTSEPSGADMTFLRAVVLSPSGKVVYPPAIAFEPASTGSAPVLVTLAPGQSLESTGYVDLRSDTIRGYAATQIGGETVFIHTPSLRLRLLKPDPPQLNYLNYYKDVHGPKLGVVFALQGKINGNLHYTGWVDCDYPSLNALTRLGSPIWVTTSSLVFAVHRSHRGVVITPHCPVQKAGTGDATFKGMIVQFHVIAGWTGHSVATADWPQAVMPGTLH